MASGQASSTTPKASKQPGEKGCCANCDRPDSYDNYVQCDRCDAWWHFLCAGVTASIADQSFTCETCLHTNTSSRASSSSSRVAAMQLRLKEMDEERKFIQQKLELERQSFEREKQLLQQKYNLLLQQGSVRTAEWVEAIGAEGGNGDRGAAVAINTHQQEDGQNPAPNHPEQQTLSPSMQAAINSAVQAAVQAALQATSAAPIQGQATGTDANPRYSGAIPKAPPKDASSTMIEPNGEGSRSQKGKQLSNPPDKPTGKPLNYQPTCSNYDQWIQELTNQFSNTKLPQVTTAPVTTSGNVPLIQGQQTGFVPNFYSDGNKAKHFVPNDGVAPNASYNELGNPPSGNVLGSLGILTTVPTPSQLAARQVMPRELPPFSGDPADWPMFISSFVNTTVACGYTSAENLARLQRCLKGDAYESVRSRLLLPDTVPQVLNTLQLLYGRPELLINALLEKVRSVPAPKSEKLETLIDFGMAVQSLCDHLEAAGQQAHLSNPALLMELVQKLPAHTKMEWASFLQRCPEVNLQTFGVFMSSIVISASKVTAYSGGNRNLSTDKTKGKQKGFIHTHDGASEVIVQSDKRVCCVCNEEYHRVSECALFRSLSMDGRLRCVHSNGLCRNCLNAHGKRSCRYTRCCGIEGCEARHHPLLHSNRSNQPSSDGTPRGTASSNTHRPATQSTLFRIVPVTLHGPRGAVRTYAFLDDGSSLTLIEKDLIEELGVTGSPMPLCLTWTGNMSRTESKSKAVQLSISGVGDRKQMAFEGHTVSSLGLASQSMRYENLVQKFPHLRGLPVSSYSNAIPRVLVGIDNLNLTVPLKTKEGRREEPIAVKTRLGWCVYGGKGYGSSSQSLNLHACSCVDDSRLHNIVKEYFAMEDVGTKPDLVLESSEDRRARAILQQTTQRIDDRFEISLLWKFDDIELPDSYHMALKRLECFERKMDRDASLKENIHRLLNEYQEKGYAKPATREELDSADPKRIWYLPLGVVVNPKKPNKVRLIWDAAATVNGISLNSQLLKGPDQLTILPAVLARFRQFAVGVSADIKEMFHQLRMREADRHSLRFLFRFDRSKPPTVYLMNVAIFGSSCSPASAQYVKNLNAEEFVDRYPQAADAIIHNHYVDDYLDSFEDAHQALRVSQEVRMIHSKGGFHLRNWQSNKKQFLDGMGENNSDETKSLLIDKASDCERVLGMLWQTDEDVLCFSTHLKAEVQVLLDNLSRPTKRQMLRCLMSFFDPLGILNIILVHGRILLQDVWRAGIQWDETVDDDLWERWIKWTRALKLVDQIRIPRCYFKEATLKSYSGLQLHVFVDASELAYSAVAYFRIVTADGIPECTVVAAKAKVAPLKPLSVPRLELQAAVLGARLMRFVIDSHTVVVVKRFLWSDSSTVLAWIKSDHRRYKQYVACRIGELLTLSEPEEWKWVPTKLNPADAATKWGKGPCVDVGGAWFKGPEFLRKHEEEWPQQKSIQINEAAEEELRPCHVHQKAHVSGLEIDYLRFSKWERLLRTVAYVMRFIGNLKRMRSGAAIQNGILSREELQEAEITLFRSVQWQTYADEMAMFTVEPNPSLESSSVLHSLCPLMDQHGILRVDSRIKAADEISSMMKFPIILPRTHRLTLLLIDECHRRFCHANFETVVNEIRQRYHVSRLRITARSVVNNCQQCKIKKAKAYVPRMAPLPPARLATFVRPFSYVGLDFFGPFLVKVGRGNVKRWIALFTCLTIRAVHVEVVSSLTTRSCIECVRRFVCRRGIPIEIYSDNGTNFRGAARLLKEQQEAIRNINQDLAGTFTSTTTKWLFIPPAAPHMGGAWERMVRSVKTALFSAYEGNRTLTDETLQTLVIEAEALVNARPLTYLPLESAKSEALTPNHFLVPLGNSNHVQRKKSGDDGVPDDQRQLAEMVEGTWNTIQQHLDAFWRRWIKEYLPTLTKRTKWFDDPKAVAVGDLVMVIDGNTRNEWVRGRVLEVVPGSDGRIRQAVIQIARGVVRRPVSKLAILEVKKCG